MSNPALHRYLKKVRQNLTCPEKEKQKFLKDLENSVSEYLVDIPNASEADLFHRFGNPAEIAQSFLQEEDFEEVQKKIMVRKRVIWVISLAAIILVIAAIILGGIFVADTYSFNHGYYIEEVGQGPSPSNSQNAQTY